jgi:hypothetical protein
MTVVGGGRQRDRHLVSAVPGAQGDQHHQAGGEVVRRPPPGQRVGRGNGHRRHSGGHRHVRGGSRSSTLAGVASRHREPGEEQGGDQGEDGRRDLVQPRAAEHD